VILTQQSKRNAFSEKEGDFDFTFFLLRKLREERSGPTPWGKKGQSFLLSRIRKSYINVKGRKHTHEGYPWVGVCRSLNCRSRTLMRSLKVQKKKKEESALRR